MLNSTISFSIFHSIKIDNLFVCMCLLTVLKNNRMENAACVHILQSSLTVRLINTYHTHMQVKEMKSLREVSLMSQMYIPKEENLNQ